MIVVDTTVWVDLFAGREHEVHVAELLRLIDVDAGVARARAACDPPP